MNKTAVSYLGNCRTNICLKNASGAKCSIRVSGMLVFLRALPTAKYCRRCLSSAPHCGHLAYFRSFAGDRKYARCPQCGALERHRLQYLAVGSALKNTSIPETRMLHFAPEAFFKQIFVRQFPKYETADLFMKGVDHKVDLQDLPVTDGSYDLVFASHVLEHIRDDKKAIREIRRILKPNGVAILPVPIVCAHTIEYPEANPREAGHVRAPGPDYFENNKESFSRVEIYSSQAYPERY